MNRRYPDSRNPEVNSANVGGRVPAWVAKRIAGLLAASHRVRVLGHQPTQERVELCRRDSRRPSLECCVNRRDELVHVAPGLSGHVHPGGPLHAEQISLDLLVQVVAPFVVDQVPLVVGQHQRAARLDHHREDARVLLADWLARVDEHDGNLGLGQRRLGAQAREVLAATCLVDSLADSGGVDEPPLLTAELDELVDRVDRRAGDGVDDHSVLAGQPVQQARLADVGASEQGHSVRPPDDGSSVELLGHCREQRVEQLPRSPAVQRRHGERLTQAQAPQRRRLELLAGVVDLVGRQDDGLLGPSQHLDDGFVGVGDAHLGIDDQQHDVGGIDGHLSLRSHPGSEPARIPLPSPGVDDDEVAPRPGGVVGDPVTGDAGTVLDDCLTTADDAVDQR